MKRAETWEEFMTLMLNGIAHDLSNRSTALTGIRYMAADDDPEALERFVQREQERMEVTLYTLQSFPRATDSVMLHDPVALLDTPVRIARWLKLAPTVELALGAGLPAVRVAGAPLQRGILMALACAGRREGVMRLRADAGAAALIARVDVVDATASMLEEVAVWVERGGGTVRLDDGMMEIRIPEG